MSTYTAGGMEIALDRRLLDEVDRRMEDVLFSPVQPLYTCALHPLKAGGKRIRPALVLCAARLGVAPFDAVVNVATAVELVHSASLVHDDLVDGAHQRRSCPTVNALWGNTVSVLAGDYLFATAFELLTRHDEHGVLGVFTRAIRRMCEGEIREIASVGNLERSEAEYMQCIEEKTASLFQAACESGALLGGLPREMKEDLRDFGRCLGLTFQLVDDVLDLSADPDTLGKPVLNDVRSGVYTLPVIRALTHPTHGQELRALLKCRESLGSEDLAAVRELISSSGGVEYTLNRAMRNAEMAESILSSLPDGAPRRTLGEILRACTEYVN